MQGANRLIVSGLEGHVLFCAALRAYALMGFGRLLAHGH